MIIISREGIVRSFGAQLTYIESEDGREIRIVTCNDYDYFIEDIEDRLETLLLHGAIYHLCQI